MGRESRWLAARSDRECDSRLSAGIAATPFGRIRLGGAAALPEFSWRAWLAMLFSAGMGIGLVFYGVAEPIYHLAYPPLGAEPGSVQAYRDAAWSPFVGLFIARISRGRTIREFICGTLLVATLMTFVWLAVFGNAALFIELEASGGLVAAVQANLDRSLFVFFEMLTAASDAALPSWWVSGLALLRS